jgi:Arc/MetJ-type ribon-helix-helix transcriptional regulator
MSDLNDYHIQTRVPSELYQKIEEYEEEGAYMNQSEAIRHLLRAGLDAEAEEEPAYQWWDYIPFYNRVSSDE